MKKNLLKTCALAAALVAYPSTPANATVWTLGGSMDAVQAGTAGSGGTGTGTAMFTLDDATGIVTLLSGSFSGLSGNTTVAHIHGYSGPGMSSSPIVNLTIDLGVTSGNIISAATTPVNSANMLSGLTYVNIHTSTFGGGEIRGQLTVVPEPASLSLLGIGGLALFSRRLFRRC